MNSNTRKVAISTNQIAGLLCLLLCFASTALRAEEDTTRVQVIEAYIEMHTGPGRGFPVFHVEERGSQIEILKQKTGWYKIRNRKGKTGWVKRDDLQRTLVNDQPLKLPSASLEDFRQYRRELALMIGDYDGADVMTVSGTWYFSKALGMELAVSRVLADFSDSTQGTISLVSRPFDIQWNRWGLSPFFTLGTGVLDTDPKVTLVQQSDSTDQTAHVGLGANLYLSRHFMFQVQYTNHVIFDSSDDNQEIDEWKAGLSLFF
ncbi:MAG: SH3 domain-containing protein [Gammaproteobacteria bacterium]